MSKEVMIGMLKVANNGNEMLQILDALVENEGDNITGDAVDFVGDIVNFWWHVRGAKITPFLLKYIKIMLFLC